MLNGCVLCNVVQAYPLYLDAAGAARAIDELDIAIYGPPHATANSVMRIGFTRDHFVLLQEVLCCVLCCVLNPLRTKRYSIINVRARRHTMTPTH